MAVKSAAMEAHARKWNASDLKTRWLDIKSKTPIPGFSSGKALEYLIIRAFEIEGADVRWPYEVTHPQKTGTMEQIDGFIYVDGRPYLIECKDLADPVAIETIAKIRFRLEARPPETLGLVFSMKDYTTPTEIYTQFAVPKNVMLWGLADMEYAINAGKAKAGLNAKRKYIFEHGLPWLILNSKVAP